MARSGLVGVDNDSLGGSLDHDMPRVHERIDEVASRYPDRLAVCCGEAELTYAQLAERSAALAQLLRQRGVGAGDIVALSINRSIDMIVGILGILHAEAAYLPLDPAYPAQRNADLVRMSEARVLVTSSGTPAAGLPVLTSVLVDALDGGASSTGGMEAPGGPAGSRAYVISTSGSTGAPKAIVTTHRNIAWFIPAFANELGTTSEDVVLARTSLSFDPHTVEILLPLSVGGRVVVVPAAAASDPVALLNEIVRHRVTIVQATPALWGALSARPWPITWEIKALCGGEPMSEDLKDAVLRAGDIRLWNVYGPTETTVWCSALEMRSTTPVRIGGPISGLRFCVSAEDGTAVRSGDLGELHITGPGLAEGYLNDPVLTRERFVAPPNSANPDERWYSTGDLVRPMEDGTFTFAGRVDRQVKIRGYRVELGEVEHSIRSQDGVLDACVLVDDTSLVACIRREQSSAEDDVVAERVRSTLREVLPAYMVPARVVVVSAFPLTPTEKIDSQRLLELSRGAHRLAARPTTGDQAVDQVTALWRDVLGRDDVHPLDRFFDLGGHSLNVVTIQLRLLDELGVDVSCADLYAHQTPVELAKLVTTIAGQKATTKAEPGTYPLCPSQARFFVETPLEDINRNVLQLLLKTTHPRTTVVRAVQRLLDRHDVFRIDAIESRADGCQHLAEKPVRGIDDVTGTYATTAAFLAATDELSRSMNIADGRLYASTMFEAEDGVYLYLLLHHLLGDDVSIDILKRELHHLMRNPDGPLPSTASFVSWMGEFGGNRALERYAKEIPTWISHTDASAVEPFAGDHEPTDDDRLGRSTYIWSRNELDVLNLDVRSRHDLLLAAAVHALGATFNLDAVGCRVVEGGRMLSSRIDDGLTVGWLSHHYPLLVATGLDAAATEQGLRRALASVVNRGESYNWLRYSVRAPELVEGAQLGDLPLYFNYMPEMPPTSGLWDVSDRIPSTVLARQRITGLAIVVRDTDEGLAFSVFRNPDTVLDTSFRQFRDCLLESAVELLKAART